MTWIIYQLSGNEYIAEERHVVGGYGVSSTVAHRTLRAESLADTMNQIQAIYPAGSLTCVIHLINTQKENS